VTEPYYPEEAVACLRRSRYDRKAKPALELISSAFIWSDEFEDYLEFVAHCRAKACRHYWEPIGFRSSVIRGQPDEQCRRGWEELRRVCPKWPGFREERYCESLRLELERQEAEEA
jgi:hypothetical protein